MAVVFALGALSDEIERKTRSMLATVEDLEADFLAVCERHLPPRSGPAVCQALSFARTLKTADGEHVQMRAYLTHPLRVAEMTARMQEPAVVEAVQTALLHNVFEVCALEEAALEAAGLSPRITKGIRLLTVDRDLQWDEGYLTRYYNSIEAFGADLALVKCLDKMDNFLGMRLFDDADPVWSRYISVGHRFVGPIAHRLSPALGEFVDELAAFLLANGSDPRLIARYRAFLDALPDSR